MSRPITDRPTAVDYSWGRPDLTCLRKNGYVGVMRYLSWDRTGKNITRDEAQTLHAHGMWIGLNWEQQGNWSEFSGGKLAGQINGAEAARQAAALGAPRTVPIFVSADYGAPRSHWGTIADYLKGFAAASGHPVGFYGQGDLADWLLERRVIGWIWQTNATGWGGVSNQAVLRQHIWTKVCGVDVDPNTVYGDPRQWAWMPNHPTQEDEMTPAQEAKLDKKLGEILSVAKNAHSAASEANRHSAKDYMQATASIEKKLDQILAKLT